MKKLFASLFTALAMSLAFAGTPAWAAEPTVHEIYQAADAGRMDDAQRLMREVLQAHPNSGKAHYVNAELLVRQGKLNEARGELAAAEKLSPGLPFAKAEAVSELRGKLDKPAPSISRSNNVSRDDSSFSPAHLTSGSSFPWGALLGVVAVVMFIAWAVRFMARRAGAPGGGYAPGYQQAYPGGAPAPAPYGGPGYGPAPGGYGYGAPPQAPGMGGQILGGLATGAALGAGMVAGEELVRHMTHRDTQDTNHLAGGNDSGFTPFQSIPDNNSNYDMGGNDFGVSDNSSWDDGGSSGGGGGGDWN